MAKENGYGAIRLKKDTIEYLQHLKQAFEICYGKSFTYDDFLKQMAASVEDGDIAVWETFCELTQKMDEIKQRAQERMNR